MEKNVKGVDILPRENRKLSQSDVYHIIWRGIDKQDIFYDDKDNRIFLKQLLEVKKKFKFQVFAYCLMYNHIHLVVRVQNGLISKIIQSLGIRYSQYFNKRYDRSGHLFENRFRSKNVENKQYLLELCRYVHRNPEKAGIATVEKYRWSSYVEYMEKSKIVDTQVLLHYFDNKIDDFIDFTVNQKRDLFQETRESLEYEFINSLTDKDVKDIVLKKYNLNSINDLCQLEKSQKEDIILDLKNMPGINKTQLSRVIRVSRRIIERIWEKNEKM